MYRNEIDLDAALVPNEETDEEDYHMVTEANGQLHRQIWQNPQYLDNTTGSHASQHTSTSTEKQLDPNNQLAIAINKLEKKNSQPLQFHQKTTTLPPSSI